MGALLLALADDTPIRIHDDPTKMVQEINSNIKHILEYHGKSEFNETIRLALPATQKNHRAYRKAIVETIQHLLEMNVRSAINGSDDALGRFYETFLKYANGAKEMGIVLTPRHITKFAVDVLGVSPQDKVFDPTCGTGGFLVSAMDAIRKQCGTSDAYDCFKKSGIYGVEKEDSVYGLALVNMIFRGDGKSGLEDGNCLDHEFWQKKDGETLFLKPTESEPDGAKRPFSRVFMNPPFKTNIDETRFVDYALRQTTIDGLLFAVLPAINIGGKKFYDWRKALLDRHTVKAVIKLDKNVFYPIQEGTYGLIIKAHRPHVIKEGVFMAILRDDKHRSRLSKMVSEHTKRDNMECMTNDVRDFILGKPLKVSNRSREQIIAPLKTDQDCTFCPEAYIETNAPTSGRQITTRAIDMCAAQMRVKTSGAREDSIKASRNLKKFALSDFIESTKKPPLKSIKDYPAGGVPVVSATALNNGVAKWLDVKDNDLILNGFISISKTHNTKPCQAFWHPYNFTAIATVHLIRPIAEFANSLPAVLYLCQAIKDDNAWRYDYARPVDLDELSVFLPTKSKGEVDYASIEDDARQMMPGNCLEKYQ